MEVAVEVDANGNRIGPLPPYLSSLGLPQYSYYRIPGGDSLKVEHLYGNSDLWFSVHRILNHYGEETHTREAKHFSTIINELKAGNKVIAYIDASELWNDEYFTRIWNRSDAEDLTGEEGTVLRSLNHAIWITGIDYSDPENPMIIINDSAKDTGKGARYPLERFIAAWEDVEWRHESKRYASFIYTAIGEHAPDEAFQMNRREIENQLNAHFDANDDYIGQRLINSAYFMSYIKDPVLVEQIEAENPGTKALIARYLKDMKAEEPRIYTKYGIDPELISTTYWNADIDEFVLINAAEKTKRNYAG